MVVQVNRSDGAETFAGTVASTMANESSGVITLDAMAPQMTMRVRGPAAGVPVRLKIENSLDENISVETEALTTVADGWETLTFDFSAQAMGTATFDASATYDKVVIFFNFGTDGATAGAQTFFFDDIAVAATVPVRDTTAFSTVTFDDSALAYTLRGFGGAEDSTVVADPADAGNMVAQVNRSATAATFAGTVPSLFANESFGIIPLDAMNLQMTVRVRAPEAGITVRLKLEDALDPTVTLETEASTTVANDWETLIFDFANPVTGTPAFDANATYDKAAIFFNFGAGRCKRWSANFLLRRYCVRSRIRWWREYRRSWAGRLRIPSNRQLVSHGVFLRTLIIHRRNHHEPRSIWHQYIGNRGVITARAGGQPFAGAVTTDLPTFTLDSSNAVVKVMVWKTVISDVGIKFEDAMQGSTGEIRVANTVTNQWEELTFDFTGVIGNPVNTDITGLVIFPDFDDDGRGQDNVVYFDNITCAMAHHQAAQPPVISRPAWLPSPISKAVLRRL